MALTYPRTDSPDWWMRLKAPGEKKATLRSTGIPRKARTPEEAKAQRHKAESIAAIAKAKHVEEFNAGPAAKAAKKEAERPARRLREQLAWYRTNVSPQNRGEAEEGYLLDAFAAGPLGGLLLSEIDAACLQEWMAARARQVKAGTVNREMDLLKSVLRSAVEGKYLAASPAAGLARLKAKEETRIYTMSPAAEKALLRVMKPIERVLLLIALDTLIRLGDLIDLRWDAIEGRRITVRDPKNGEEYRTVLSPRARKALSSLPQEEDYVFPKYRKAQPEHRANSVKQMFEKACAAAGVPYGRGKGITWHSATRHTGASRMGNDGTNEQVIAAVGGWKGTRMVSKYTHPNEMAMLAAVGKIEKAKGGAVLRFDRAKKRKAG